LIAASVAGLDVEVVTKTTEEWKADKEMQAKNLTGRFPFLERSDGKCIFESAAIAAHFARQGDGLFGKSSFELGQVE